MERDFIIRLQDVDVINSLAWKFLEVIPFTIHNMTPHKSINHCLFFKGCVLKLTRKAIEENRKIQICHDAKLLCSSIVCALIYRIITAANTINKATNSSTLNLYILEAAIKSIFLDIDILLVDRAYKITERYKVKRDKNIRSNESLTSQDGITIFISKVKRLINEYSKFKRQ